LNNSTSVPYSAPHEEWTISKHLSSEDLEVKDRPNEDWFSLVDARRKIKLMKLFLYCIKIG